MLKLQELNYCNFKNHQFFNSIFHRVPRGTYNVDEDEQLQPLEIINLFMLRRYLMLRSIRIKANSQALINLLAFSKRDSS